MSDQGVAAIAQRAGSFPHLVFSEHLTDRVVASFTDLASQRNLLMAAVCVVLLAVAIVVKNHPQQLRIWSAASFISGYACCVLITAHTLMPADVSWSYSPFMATVANVPADVLLLWSIVWGGLPTVATMVCPPRSARNIIGLSIAWVAGLFYIDVLTMPQLSDVVTLASGWMWFDIVLVAVIVGPVPWVAHAWNTRTQLATRVVFQVLTATLLMLIVIPVLAFQTQLWLEGCLPTSGVLQRQHPLGLHHWLAMPWLVRGLTLCALALCLVPALIAALDLYRIGQGTPFPWDPPECLVTTGPYAYTANPMQMGVAAAYVVLSLASGSWAMLIAAGVATVFSYAVAQPHEEHAMTMRWPEYRAYRTQVQPWRIRYRPAHTSPEAKLWISHSCTDCMWAAQTLQLLPATGLTICDADTRPQLQQATWDCGSDHCQGVTALSLAYERTVLPLAYVSWFLRLPGIAYAVDGVSQSVGFGRYGAQTTTPAAAAPRSDHPPL